jgi:hypothetical protein
MVKIKNTRFIGLLSYIIMFFLRAKFSTPRKLNNLFLLNYYIVYFFTRFGSTKKELLFVL